MDCMVGAVRETGLICAGDHSPDLAEHGLQGQAGWRLSHPDITLQSSGEFNVWGIAEAYA